MVTVKRRDKVTKVGIELRILKYLLYFDNYLILACSHQKPPSISSLQASTVSYPGEDKASPEDGPGKAKGLETRSFSTPDLKRFTGMKKGPFAVSEKLLRSDYLNCNFSITPPPCPFIDWLSGGRSVIIL